LVKGPIKISPVEITACSILTDAYFGAKSLTEIIKAGIEAIDLGNLNFGGCQFEQYGISHGKYHSYEKT
jgi:hypothetical protein